MKILVVLIVFGSLVVLTSGCTTMCVSQGVDSYKLGRLSAVAYLTQKDKLEPKVVKGIETVYKAFDMLVGDSGDSEAFKAILINKLKEESKGDAKELVIVLELVDMYWDKFEANFNMSSLIGKERIEIFATFNRGVKEALNDYNFLNQ